MALLMNAMRASAFTQSQEPVNDWLAGRQWGRWIAPFAPKSPRPSQAEEAEKVRSLEELREQGVITDAELQSLRARLRL